MSSVSLHAALRSGKGNIRQNNEDAFYFNGEYAPLEKMDLNTEKCAEYQNDQVLFAVCDGMGGHDNGELASYIAVSRMADLQQALLSNDFSSAMMKWTAETNRAILRDARNGGCTLVLNYFHRGVFYIAHIGDSRVYRYHKGILSRETKDHSKLQVLLDAGILTEKEAETYPQRHVVTRVLGMDEEDNGRCLPTIRDPLYAENGDRYMMCTDGITDMLTDQQISFIIQQNNSAKSCASAIYQAAMDAGGKDNATVLVVDVYRLNSEPDDSEDKDPFETTLSPEQRASKSIHIEQVVTIEQFNEQKITFRSHISNF